MSASLNIVVKKRRKKKSQLGILELDLKNKLASQDFFCQTKFESYDKTKMTFKYENKQAGA